MLRVPGPFLVPFQRFAPLFRARSWQHAEMLLVGAILTPGQRAVTSILRVSGLARERCFVNYHRVLNRAAWSGREAARVLLGLLLAAFAPSGPVVLGLDDAIERRRVAASLLAGSSLDRSRLDMAIARRLLRRGASAEHVAATIAAGSKARSLPARKAEAYVRRTHAAAMRDAAQRARGVEP